MSMHYYLSRVGCVAALLLATMPAVSYAEGTSTAAPSGWTLLREMRRAVLRAGSYHYSSVERSVGPGSSRYVDRKHGNRLLHSDRDHVLYTIRQVRKHGHVTVTRQEEITVGHLQAVRRDHGPWKCIDWSLPSRKSGRGSISVTVSAPLTIIPRHLQDVVTLGAARVGGVPVWHVYARSSVNQSTFGIRTHDHAAYNFYISQADDTLLRENSSDAFRVQKSVTYSHTREDYSEYGMDFPIRLPSGCHHFTRPFP